MQKLTFLHENREVYLNSMQKSGAEDSLIRVVEIIREIARSR